MYPWGYSSTPEQGINQWFGVCCAQRNRQPKACCRRARLPEGPMSVTGGEKKCDILCASINFLRLRNRLQKLRSNASRTSKRRVSGCLGMSSLCSATPPVHRLPCTVRKVKRSHAVLQRCLDPDVFNLSSNSRGVQ